MNGNAPFFEAFFAKMNGYAYRYIYNLMSDFSICFSEHLTGHPIQLLFRSRLPYAPFPSVPHVRNCPSHESRQRDFQVRQNTSAEMYSCRNSSLSQGQDLLFKIAGSTY